MWETVGKTPVLPSPCRTASEAEGVLVLASAVNSIYKKLAHYWLFTFIGGWVIQSLWNISLVPLGLPDLTGEQGFCLALLITILK